MRKLNRTQSGKHELARSEKTLKRVRRPSKAAQHAAAAEAAGAPSAGAAAAAGQASTKAQRSSVGKRHHSEVAPSGPEIVCFSRAQQAVRIGTSGYSYTHWRHTYYQGLPQRFEWELFSKEFDTLELNATFYGWYKEPQFDAWRERAAAVRPSFEYVVKGQQFYTHRKRLNIDAAFTDSWRRFWDCCTHLGPHLGPVLFQFPANFRTTSGKGDKATSNIDRLRRLGEVLPPRRKFVFEFRHASWFCPEVYDVLRQHNWCLAITHLTDAPHGKKLAKGGWIGTLSPGPNPRPEEYPLDTCSWGVYVRFHGSEGQYRGQHGAAELRRWAERAKAWVASGRRVYFAFNNDVVRPHCSLPDAITDCRALAAALRANGMWPD